MSSNKYIAKNTVMLYVRMIISVCINLYASREILKVLGVEDFGIYNIVGGVVAMLGFLNASMSGCTSRFITYEIGRGDKENLKKTFSAALQIHIFIACFVLILGETLGLWFVNSQLVIPESRITATNYVYQFSLLSAVVSFIQVPYSADVISHERMDAYAYIEILNVSLKLGVVFLLLCAPFDKLIAYSILLSLVAIIIFIIYRLFCRKHFEESIFSVKFNIEILKPMIRFTSWDLYGNACVIVQQQGVNVLINRFFGVVLNAATGVATQASSAVSMFVSSFTMALRPPLIKRYASGDIEGMQKLLTIAIVLSMFLAELICVPLYLRIEYIMELWLTDVPQYATSFCKWLLLANSVLVINSLFTSVIHATGNIKRLSIIGGSLYLSIVLISYFLFRVSYGPVTTYVVWFLVSILMLISNIVITKKQVSELSLSQLVKSVIIPCVALFLTVISALYINSLLPNNIWGVVLLFLFNALIALILLYILWLGPNYGWNPMIFIRNSEL